MVYLSFEAVHDLPVMDGLIAKQQLNARIKDKRKIFGEVM